MQQQLKGSNESYDESFRSRLSRVVVKIFARVVKAEENVGDPYVQGRIDMEALICSLEDILACNENSIPSEAKDVTIEMIKSLIQSILTVQGSARPIRGLMEDLGIDPITSALGKLVMQCDGEVDDQALPTSDIVRDNTINTAPPKMTPSKDVASLVARLGSAPPGEEREAALASIRAYKSEYGDKELDIHLQQLSGPFREFIIEQISREPSPTKKRMTKSEGDYMTSNNDSVTDRIRSLRSRLQASEGSSPQKTLEKVADGPIQPPTRSDDNIAETTHARSNNDHLEAAASRNIVASDDISYHKTNNVSAASPSKIPSLKVAAFNTTISSNNNNGKSTNNETIRPPTTSTPPPESKIPVPGLRPSRLPGVSSSIPSFSASSSSAQALRERLAARQVGGGGVTTKPLPPATAITNATDDKNEDMEKSSIVPTLSSSASSSSSSIGRAAALRARLEVVKQQSNNHKQ